MNKQLTFEELFKNLQNPEWRLQKSKEQIDESHIKINEKINRIKRLILDIKKLYKINHSNIETHHEYIKDTIWRAQYIMRKIKKEIIEDIISEFKKETINRQIVELGNYNISCGLSINLLDKMLNDLTKCGIFALENKTKKPPNKYSTTSNANNASGYTENTSNEADNKNNN